MSRNGAQRRSAKMWQRVLDARLHMGYYEPSKENDMEKPTFKGAMTEQEWDELRDRVRAQKFLIEWENELYETGVDEDAEWFIQYVWEKI
jgi:hypothetical protein